MRSVNIIVIILWAVVYTKAQNLVFNPSFEMFDECPEEVTMYSIKKLIPYWNIPTRGTTDYFNACAMYQVGVPNNVMGNMLALDSNAYAGIVMIESPPFCTKRENALDYREYLQTKLKKPLETGSLYVCKFYFSIASYSTYAVNRIGMYISTDKEQDRFSAKALSLKPQIVYDTLNIACERDYWYLVCDTFRARGGEKYITIGNFYDDLNTDVITLNNSNYRNYIRQKIKNNKIAYYYIDMVSVFQVSDTASNFCKDKYLIK
ncbi:MAG: hypothetical protein MI739_13085 [Bacteroidales bacterium]|nr:hypothetical protein [Bacteroidales bacterium]